MSAAMEVHLHTVSSDSDTEAGVFDEVRENQPRLRIGSAAWFSKRLWKVNSPSAYIEPNGLQKANLHVSILGTAVRAVPVAKPDAIVSLQRPGRGWS
jgi:hypothetical protein